jgi:SWI/SNF-related matrix-associated actin-dependent regulator 1 of chromatin subfamily A
VWRTLKIERVAAFTDACDPAIREDVVKAKDDVVLSIAASASTVAPEGLSVPCPVGLAYRDYQLAGIQYALAHPHCLIGDDMRLGKTVQALGVCNYLDAKRVLVVCPATLKINWLREMEKWLVGPHSTSIINGRAVPLDTNHYVINYDILHNHMGFLKSQEWDVIIYDESHKLRGPKSRRTKLTLGNGTKKWPGLHAARRLFLSGTQLYTRPRDLWTMCMTCDPDGLGRGFWRFLYRYCDAYTDHFGRVNTDGAKNEEELQRLMREAFMIRRTKEQVSDELPPVHQVIPLDRVGVEKLLKAEHKVLSQNTGRIASIVGSLACDNALDGWLTPQSESDSTLVEEVGHYATIRRELGLKKVSKVTQFVDTLLESVHKIVIFAHHRDVVTELAAHFPNSVRVMGGMTAVKKQEAVDKFQDDPECRVFVGNILSAGEGISLAAANVAVFAEISGVASEMDQAERRLALIEKTEQNLIYYCVNEGSLDEQLVKALKTRRETFQKAMNGERIVS